VDNSRIALVVSLTLLVCFCESAGAVSASIDKPAQNAMLAVGGTYEFKGTALPDEDIYLIWWESDGGAFSDPTILEPEYFPTDVGYATIYLQILWDFDHDGVPDASADAIPVVVRQYLIQLCEDTGNSTLTPPEPEQTTWGVLAPMSLPYAPDPQRARPINMKFSIEGPYFPATVLFNSYSLYQGTGGRITHAGSQQVNGPGTWTITGSTGSFGKVTGVEVSQMQNGVELDIRMGSSDPNEGIGHTKYLTVAQPMFVLSDTQLTVNPARPGQPTNLAGYRIYPGKEDADENEDHRRTFLEAAIVPPVPGEVVWLHYVDVDDPSHNGVNDCDTNDTSVLCRGNDNHHADGASFPNGNSSVTDDGGEAEIEFCVGLNAGDNYRLVASFWKDYADSVGPEEQGNGLDLLDQYALTLPTVYGGPGDMITVWRRLHIERDRMLAPPASQPKLETYIVEKIDGGSPYAVIVEDNLADGSPLMGSGTGRGRFGTAPTFPGVGLMLIEGRTAPVIIDRHDASRVESLQPFTIEVTLEDSEGENALLGEIANFDFDSQNEITYVYLSVTFDEGFYDGGTITFGNTTYSIDVSGTDSVAIDGQAKVSCTLKDDDSSDQPPTPSVALMGSADNRDANRYFDAYITPVVGPAGWHTDDVAFKANLYHHSVALIIQFNQSRYALTHDETYWRLFLLSSYQGPTYEDGDSDSEPYWPGGAIPIGGTVFCETVKDLATVRSWTHLDLILARAFIHEGAHQFNGVGNKASGLMVGNADTLFAPGGTLYFDEATLREIRADRTGPGD